MNIVSRQSQMRQRLNEKNEKDLQKAMPKVVKKKEKEERKKKEDEVPKFFVELIEELGFDKKDAKNLFENKEKWSYLKSDRLIHCAQIGEFSKIPLFDSKNELLEFIKFLGCKFSVPFAANCLVEHCIKEHGFRTIPCPYDYCKYEAFNETVYKESSKFFKYVLI